MRYALMFLLFISSNAFACGVNLSWVHEKAPHVNPEILKYACTEAESVGVPVKTVVAIMYVESTFNTYAHSDTSYGIMQIHAAVHPNLRRAAYKKFHTWNLYDWRVNIWIGVRLLKRLRDRSPNMQMALQHYNGTVKNTTYSSKVFAFEKHDESTESNEDKMLNTLNDVLRSGHFEIM